MDLNYNLLMGASLLALAKSIYYILKSIFICVLADAESFNNVVICNRLQLPW